MHFPQVSRAPTSSPPSPFSFPSTSPPNSPNHNSSESSGLCLVSPASLRRVSHLDSRVGIPRLVSYGTCAYYLAIRRAVVREYTKQDCTHDEPLVLKSFNPWIKLTKDDLGPQDSGDFGPGSWYEFNNEESMATSNSWCLLFNNFFHMETSFVDHWNREFKPKAWCVGPLCFAGQSQRGLEPKPEDKPVWMQWLDTRESSGEGRKVFYVAFGTQVSICEAQMREIAVGLEGSGVGFLWVVRLRSESNTDLDSWLEGRVKERGLIVRDWVDQMEILSHGSVGGFLSHCGWNSVSESICASVPILAWPMIADQFLNAKMVVEELGISLRISGVAAGGGGVIGAVVLQRMVNELMVEEKGKKLTEKVTMVGEEARRAMTEGGSSSVTLDLLITEVLEYSAVETEQLKKAHGSI